jgi:formylglycine-generating enzyme required for sulfatase activity
VWEWTASRYSDSYDNYRTNISRVDRGGGFYEVDPSYVRAAVRGLDPLSSRDFSVGFRCARSN